MRTRSLDRRITRSHASVIAKTIRGTAARSTSPNKAGQPNTKATPVNTNETDIAKDVDVSVLSSKSLQRKRLSFKRTPKRRKLSKRGVIEIEHDPYELSGDEIDSPISFPATSDTQIPSDKPDIPKTTGDKKRKFFITRTLEDSKRPNFFSLESIRQKRKTAARRIPKLLHSRSRAQPLTNDERARIAATTIWLPLPSHHQNPQEYQENTPPLPSTSQVPPARQPTSPALHQNLAMSPPREGNDNFPEFDGGDCPDDKDAIFTGKPSIRMSTLTTSLISANASKVVPMSGPCSTPLSKLTVNVYDTQSTHDHERWTHVSHLKIKMAEQNNDQWGCEIKPSPFYRAKPRMKTLSDGGGVQPFADVSNVLVSSVKRQTTTESVVNDQQETRRISFAQPLSPIPKRNSSSRGSSGQSASGLKIKRRNRSQDEDQSNYEEWLKEFNSQLKPYEDFNLTID